MTKKIVAAALLSRSEFDSFLKTSKASEASKKRYETAWRSHHEDKARVQVGNKVKKPGVKELERKTKAVKESTTRKEVTTKETVKEKKYPISEKRLNVGYNEFRDQMKDKKPETQARYWSAWQNYREAHKTPQQKEHPEYRIILKVTATAEGQRIEYFSSFILSKKKLSRKDLLNMKNDIQVGTNVKVTKVEVASRYDNWTGKKV